MTLYIMTLAEMKTVLGINDTRDDALLTIWMQGIQSRFDQACRRTFLYGTGVEEIFDGGVSEILVKRFPVDSVTAVWLDGDLLSSADYTIDRRRGALAFGDGVYPWPEGMQTIEVEYAGGFVKSDGTAGPLTDDAELGWVRRAMLMQCSFEWRNRENMGLGQVSARGVSVQAAAGVALALQGQTLLPEVETILAPMKRWA